MQASILNVLYLRNAFLQCRPAFWSQRIYSRTNFAAKWKQHVMFNPAWHKKRSYVTSILKVGLSLYTTLKFRPRKNENIMLPSKTYPCQKFEKKVRKAPNFVQIGCFLRKMVKKVPKFCTLGALQKSELKINPNYVTSISTDPPTQLFWYFTWGQHNIFFFLPYWGLGHKIMKMQST